jgi:hypothetical protein
MISTARPGVLRTAGLQPSEPKVAWQLLARLRRKQIHARTLGADQGYHSKAFIEYLREHHIRKRIEEIFGWLIDQDGATGADQHVVTTR